MPTAGPLKPNHKSIVAYYDALKTYAGQHVEHEGALETAFSRLLTDTARPQGWTLIPKMPLKVGSKTIIPDGMFRDEFYLRHRYREAKDTHDDLDAEIRAKIKKGYPLSNTIYEDTREAVLFQNGQERNSFDLTNPQQLADPVNDFYTNVEPKYEE